MEIYNAGDPKSIIGLYVLFIELQVSPKFMELHKSFYEAQ